MALLAMALVAGVLLIVHMRGSDLRPPPPGPASTTGAPEPELPASLLTLGMEMDGDAFERWLEAAVPQSFGDLERRLPHPADPRIVYAVMAERSALEAEFRDDSLHLRTTLRYAGRLWFDAPLAGELTASCGAAIGSAPQATLRLSLPLALDASWRLRPGTQIRLEAASTRPEDRCLIALGPLRLDATETLLSTARELLQEQAAALDSLVAASEVRGSALRAWSRLQEPIRLSDDAWLVLRPLGILQDRFGTGSPSGRVSVRLGLKVHPRIVVGERPDPTPVPLPALDTDSLGDTFEVLVETRIEHSSTASLLAGALRGRELSAGGRSVQVTDVVVSGPGDGRLAVTLRVDGAVRGVLHLVGTPSFERATGMITVPDLRFSVETRNILARSAAWLLQGTLPRRIREHARWSVRDAVERARSVAWIALSQPVEGLGRMEGEIHGVEVASVRATPAVLAVVSRVRGRALLRLEP